MVDASVALKLAVPEPGAAEAQAIFSSESTHAPDFVRCEIVNGLINDLRMHPRSRSDVTTDLDLIAHSYMALHPTAELLDRAFEIGLDLDHQVYNCLYLALAERLGFALVTADNKFLKKAPAQGWTILRPLAP